MSLKSFVRSVIPVNQRVFVGLVTLFLAATISTAPYVAAQTNEEQLIAAKPFIAAVIDGMAITKNSSGTPLAVAIVQGINTSLQIVDLKTMKRVLFAEQRSDGRQTSGRAYVTLQNRHVLVGTSTGFVYDIDPDKLTATELNVPASTGLSFRQAILGSQDTAYATAMTATGPKLLMYQTKSSLWREVAVIPSAEHGLAYRDGTVYVGGLGTAVTSISSAGVVGLLPLQTLPDGTTAVTVEGVVGDYAYITAQGPKAATLVYHIPTHNVVQQLPVTGPVSGEYAASVQPKPADQAAQQSVTATQQTESPQATSAETGTTSGSQTEPSSTSSQEGSGQQAGGVPKQQSSNRSQTAQNQQSATNPVQSPAQSTTTTQTATATQPGTQEHIVAVPEMTLPQKAFYGSLTQYDPLDKSMRRTATADGFVPVAGTCWYDATHCVTFDRSGRVGIVYSAGRSVKVTSPFVGGYQPVGHIVLGADDTMYSTSVTPGAPVLQVTSGRTNMSKIVRSPADTVTSLAVVNGVVLAGTEKGGIAHYQPQVATQTPQFEQPTAVSTGAVVGLLPAQDGKVLFVANDAAKKQSIIATYDAVRRIVSGSVQTVATGQAASIAATRTMVYVGTSGSDGTLVAFDRTTNTVLKRVAPLPRAGAITGLAVGANGHIYGVADATLFELDPTSLAVLHSRPFYKTDAMGNVVAVQGRLVASVAGKIYEVNEDDFTVKQIASGTNVALSSMSDLYYSRDGAIYTVRGERPEQNIAIGSTSPGINLAGIGQKLGMGAAAILTALLIVPMMRLLVHRPTYRLQR